MANAANAAYLARIGSSFSNPATAALGLVSAAATLANALDINRSIKFAISNCTKKKLKLIGSHMDCGEIENAPDKIEPGKSAEGYVKAKFGAFGVKGALIYQWGDDERERICIFLENPARGANRSGIQYYWNTWKNWHWYYCQVPALTGNREMKHVINNWFTIKAYISGGNHAGGAFVLET
ncbi:hypothetical protein FGB62_69g00 [Gracilaria domingensis]|nr:hypothetical protein FGB62_69g00 [Gracilaria domingensis]